MNLFKIGVILLFFQLLIIIIEPFLYPLQIFYAKIIHDVLNLPISGNMIYTNNYILEIDPLCTGILTYFTLISFFFAFFKFFEALKWSILFLPVVFFLNLLRIILTCLLVDHFGSLGIKFHNAFWIFDTFSVFLFFIIVYNYINKNN